MYFNVELHGFSANKEPFKMSCGDQQGASMKSSGRKAARNRCQEYEASINAKHRRVQSIQVYHDIP